MNKILKLTLIILFCLFTTPLYAAISNGDIDNEDFADITDWTNTSNGDGTVSQATFDSKSCVKLESGAAPSAGDIGQVSQDVGTFGARTIISISIYFDDFGLIGENNHFRFRARGGSAGDNAVNCEIHNDGIRVFDGTSFVTVTTDTIAENAWTEITFDCDWDNGLMDIYIGGVETYSNADISYNYTGITNGTIELAQAGYTTANQTSYVDWELAGSDFAPTTSGKQFIWISE